MVHPMIYGSTSLAYSPLSPSPSALVHSSDGQYAVVTRDELHLLTPKLPEPKSDDQSQPRTNGKKGKGKSKATSQDQLPDPPPIHDPSSSSSSSCSTRNWEFNKTLLKIEKKNLIKWSEWVDDSEVITCGQFDSNWRSASFSPSGISKLGGCVLATLTTNAEVLVFEPSKDAGKGEWEEMFDLTSCLVNELINLEMPRGIEQNPGMRRELSGLVMKAQACCIEWSGPITFENQTKDLSILAVGHRSGEISLWRYERENTRCLGRFRPGGKGEVNWVIGLKWSKWRKGSEGNGFEADLAISDSDGRVWVQTITQDSTPRVGQDQEGDENMEPNEEEGEKIEVGEERCLEIVGEKDRRSVSQMLWVKEESGKSCSLVYTKLGTVNLVRFSSTSEGAALEVEENKEIELLMPCSEGGEGSDARWKGSSNWSTCAGILHDPQTNSILIQLSSSLLYHLPLSLPLLSTLSPSPSYTRQSRSLFESLLQGTSGNGVKRKKLSLNDGAKVLGVVPLVNGGEGFEFGNIFETERPDSFNYKPPSTVKTWFAIVGLQAEVGDESEGEEGLLKRIEAAFMESSNAVDSPPHQALLPILDSISLYSASASFVTRLQTILNSNLAAPVVPPMSFRSIDERVMQSLYGPPELERLRKKETIAKRLASQVDLPPTLSTSVKITQLLVSRQLMKLVIEALTSILSQTPSLSESEKALFSRLLLTSSALPPLIPPSSDPDEEALFARQDIDQLSTGFESNLSCPACRAPVPLLNVRKATCLNGHQWERCSITLDLVSGVNVRTCTGCQRKSLLGMGAIGGRMDGDEWERVRGVLESTKSCVYCRGRWMRVR